MLDNYYNEKNVKKDALEVFDIKGYTIYLLNIEIYGGLCCLAFKNKHFIKEDLCIWHSSEQDDIEMLKQGYLDRMRHTLFTEDELSEVSDPSDYDVKLAFLRDHYCNQVDHLSIFGLEIIKGKYMTNVENYKRKEKKYPVTNAVCLSRFKEEDRAFSDKIYKLYIGLQKGLKKAQQSDEYVINDILKEMENHEYEINWQADWDVCSCYGLCEYSNNKGYVEYLREIGKETWIPMYTEARRRYYKTREEIAV